MAKGLIEEYSKYSYRNVDAYLAAMSNLRCDNTDYAHGLFRLGQFYGRCYRFNRGRNPLLRWGYFSCKCFEHAAEIDATVSQTIKADYESILSAIRKNAMDMSDYERYYHSLKVFMIRYHTPNNPWIWYSYLHCEILICPSEATKANIEHVINEVIPKIDDNNPLKSKLQIHFFRLLAEIEYELNDSDVIQKAKNRIDQIPDCKRSGVAWEQLLSSYVTIATAQKEYALSNTYLDAFKQMSSNGNLYIQVKSTALETELMLSKAQKDHSVNIIDKISAIENALCVARDTLRDYRAQGWIVGLLGECQVLSKDPNGERNIAKAIECKKTGKEKTKIYLNWLLRLLTYELDETIIARIKSEIERISK